MRSPMPSSPAWPPSLAGSRPSPGTTARRWPATSASPSRPGSRCTSPTPTRPGSAAATRTPTGCSASTSPKAPTCPSTPPPSSRSSRTSSTTGQENGSVTALHAKNSLHYSNKTVLRRPLNAPPAMFRARKVSTLPGRRLASGTAFVPLVLPVPSAPGRAAARAGRIRRPSLNLRQRAARARAHGNDSRNSVCKGFTPCVTHGVYRWPPSGRGQDEHGDDPGGLVLVAGVVRPGRDGTFPPLVAFGAVQLAGEVVLLHRAVLQLDERT